MIGNENAVTGGGTAPRTIWNSDGTDGPCLICAPTATEAAAFSARQSYPVEVFTGQYEFAHGRKPRGFGAWAFAIGKRGELDELFWHNGSFRAAVKAAKVEARKRGARMIEVQS